jgi:hypothetical protein
MPTATIRNLRAKRKNKKMLDFFLHEGDIDLSWPIGRPRRNLIIFLGEVGL